ncbi:hypothetical protein BH11VER1_BH11VER1_16090 [soil metagenome]
MASINEHKRAVSDLIADAFSVIPASRPIDLPPTKTIPDVPAWHDHEHKLWTLGEQIRHLINEKPNIRGDRDIYSEILKIATKRAGMRGRQSWVILFAYKPCASWADEIAGLLPDADIDGHLVSALCKMKASGFSATVLPLLNSPITWIRKKATQYLEFDKEAQSGRNGD